MAGVRKVSPAAELQALCTWEYTFGARLKNDPLYKAARERANNLVEKLVSMNETPICPLFPRLVGVAKIRVYRIIRTKRTPVKGSPLTIHATKADIEYLYGPRRRYWIEPIDESGQILPGGRTL